MFWEAGVWTTFLGDHLPSIPRTVQIYAITRVRFLAETQSILIWTINCIPMALSDPGESHSLPTHFHLPGALCSLLGTHPRTGRPDSKKGSCINSPSGGEAPQHWVGRVCLLEREEGELWLPPGSM